ncbi:hypothetical protein [uncultured Ruegeria sp.]|uniref:hypothetical protein n=1 Tax=uncultured Ruegeria sp. TaxID=259304 RepID=UPI0026309FBC|nr:hypothetical protein [uncultured Ruegeria sp.]
MADPRAQIHALMRGLINRHFPTQQSAAKEIADFWHPTGDCGDSYDTADLSRKMNGSRQWTACDVMAVQAIAGSRRVTDVMEAARQADAPVDTISNLQLCKSLLKESSEGASAMMELEEGGCKEKAVSELLDMKEVVDAALKSLGAPQ